MSQTRRQFLKTSASAAAFASLAHAAPPFPAAPASQAASRPDPSGTILVMLQLAGGNDGLNTVVPYEDGQYARSRSTLRLAGNQVHKIGSSLGFHPEMRTFARLFQEGRLAVLQGVGYPNMHRDHGAGMRAWQTASPQAGSRQTGWLGRVADQLADSEAGNVPAVFVGRIPQPLAIHAAANIVPSLRAAQDWALARAPALPARAERRSALLSFADRTTAAAWADAAKVAEVVRTGAGFPYPVYPLAQSFQAVAQLIRAELGIRIYLVEQGGVSPGGFDNHANQAGNHAVLLRELSDSVAAFCDDLAHDKLLDRVLLATYSEFGRTLSENGRHGTGHGAAAPVFLAGGRVKGGLLGVHPSLTDLDADAPKPSTDFRCVYATILERWLGVASEPILGGRFATLELLL
jgi:uncharacterized protein (DUF1501 family)